MNNEFYKLKIARLERELKQANDDNSETLATLFKMLNEKIALVAQIKSESEKIDALIFSLRENTTVEELEIYHKIFRLSQIRGCINREIKELQNTLSQVDKVVI